MASHHVIPHDTAVLITSLDGCVVAVVLEVLAPAALTLANIPVSLDELNRRQPLHHLEPELRFDAQAQRRRMCNGQPLPIHLIREKRLRVLGQREVYVS
jgi:hypothetical protein